MSPSMILVLLFLSFPLHLNYAIRSPSPSTKALETYYEYLNARLPSSSTNSLKVNPIYHALATKEKYAAPLDRQTSRTSEEEDRVNALFDVITNLTVFFKYEDLYIGKKMPLFFTNMVTPLAKLELHHPKDSNPSAIAQFCEGMLTDGEIRSCLPSLEEMLEFVVKVMGTNNVKPIVNPAGIWQNYTVLGVPKTISHLVMGCHKVEYTACAVYGCHYIPTSVVRVVPLMGDDGTTLDATIVCHLETSSWDPQHISFKAIHSKPGPPVCHFLASDDILWIPSSAP